MKARLFVFEGIDGSGKTSLSSAFCKALLESGRKAKLLSFPGKAPKSVGGLVYKIHHKPEDCGLSSLTPASLQTLHIAAHIDAIESTIIPALQGGSDIVLDRFWWSTWAYGVAANVSPKILNSLIEAERHAWGVWTPAHMFYLHRETELAQKMNEETPRILTAYTDLIEQEKHHYPVHVVKNKGSLEEVLAVLVAKVL